MRLFYRLLDRFFIKQPRLRRAVTRLIYGSCDAPVVLAGANMLVNRALENGHARAAALCESSSLLRDEIPVLVSMANLIGPCQTFVDVGANVGLYSVVFSRFRSLHPDLQIVAFEVDPRTFERLSVNAADHGFRAVRCALGAEHGMQKFVRGAVSNVTTTEEHASSYNVMTDSFDAEIQTLDDFEWSGSLLLKIDVEGQEMQVLAGARSLFEQGRITAVYLDGYSDHHCYDFLESRGFELFDGRTLMPATRQTFSLLAVRRPAPG